MRPHEIASFRALMAAQGSAPPPQRGWARLGRRGGDDAGDLPAATRNAPAPGAPSPDASAPADPLVLQEVLADWAPPPAAPPPRSPPRFGRREDRVVAAPASPLMLRLAPPAADPDAHDLDASDFEVPRPAAAEPWDGEHATPELPPERDGEEGTAPAPSPVCSPGVIAGWSRVRPPSAQRRILARLEAVFLAEHQGLEARRAGQGAAA